MASSGFRGGIDICFFVCQDVLIFAPILRPLGSSFFLCLPPKLSNGKCEPYVGSSSIVVYIVEMGPVGYIELLVVTIRVDLFCNL